jgi:hypothetical protein
MQATRRRLLALAALLSCVAISPRRLLADDAPPGAAEGQPRDVGTWRIVSIANNSHAVPLDASLMVASGGDDSFGGSADLSLDYWSLDGGHYEGKLEVKTHGASLGGIPCTVLVDDVEVASVRVDLAETVDLLPILGDNLAKLPATASIKVVMQLLDGPVTIFDYRPEQTADAMQAMRQIPDYNYNVRGMGQGSGPPGGGSSSGSHPGDCFLTTACCAQVGLADDCFELRTLRRFRDQVMLATADGRADVTRYYAVAPRVLAEMQRRGASLPLLRLYFCDILPSVAATGLGLNGMARRRYTAMMRRLERQYLPSA